jgi:hypothetical protein
MAAHHFAIEFHNEVQHLGRAVEQRLQNAAQQRLSQLAAHRRTLISATVTIEQPLQRHISHLYTVQVAVVDAKQQKHLLATRADNVEVALQQTLTLIERQLALRYPPPRPFLVRAQKLLCRNQACQLLENLTGLWRRIGLA